MKLVACSLQLENQYILMTGKIYPLAVLGIQQPLAVLVLKPHCIMIPLRHLISLHIKC